MYARLSSALLARSNRTSAAAATIATAAGPEASYVLDCGTISTATWPPAPAPITVTATSVVLQPLPPPPSTATRASSLLPPLSIARAVLDATSAHPRHPQRMSVARGPMWYAATTRSQRGYVLGRSPFHFNTASCVSSAAPSASAAVGGAGGGAATPPASATAVGSVTEKVTNAAGSGVFASDSGAGLSSSSSTSSLSSSDAKAPSTVTGTVMLPDAMVFSFKGNPHEFQDRLRGANVLVFFYKAVCGPCAAIRSKLIHAVTDHLPMDANNFIHGSNGKRTAGVASQSNAKHGAGVQQQDQQNQSIANASGAASSPAMTTSCTRSPAPSKNFTAPETAESAMATEDKEACELACRTLEDVSKAFPHRMIFLTVDTNENAKLTALHDIRSLPTFIAYRDGCMVGRVEGADEEEVRRLVHTITARAPEEQASTAAEEAEEAEGARTRNA